MKNALLLFAVFLFIGMTSTSCQKSWTCECSTTTGSDSVSFNLDGLRKNDARTRCNEFADVWGECQVKELD